MGLPVVTVAVGGLPIVEAAFGTPVTEAANGRGMPVTKVVGKPGLPVVFETIGVAPGAPPFSSVKLLLGFNGADASVGAPGMTDEGSVLRGTATVVGNAQIDTAQFKFGASSLLLDGTGSYVTFPDSADWDFGTAPFTVEGFFRFAATPTNATLVAQWDGGSNFAFFFTGGLLIFRCGGGWEVWYSFSPTLNQWYHIAFDRNAAGDARIYIDGVMVKKYVGFDAVNITGNARPLAIGSLRPDFTTYDLNGWVDEVRITKGYARYGSDTGYTVPTAAFPRS